MPLTVDLRSDTVTKPTPEMLKAMMTAEVGDDVLGDDPTVIALEQLAASVTGKEEGLFVPSGTMGNQIAIATHTRPGDAILVEEEAHVVFYEVGGPAMHSGVTSWTLASTNGAMAPETIRKRVLKANLHTPGTTLLCVENTHNRAGGTVIPFELLAEYRAIADEHSMKIHLDGARLFNAAVASGKRVSELTAFTDTVNFCLSKGLRTPVGSVLCGSADFIETARLWRKRFGGGMRQAGILAAAGIYALNNNVERLAEDHARARKLGVHLAELPGLSIDWSILQTNMVMVDTPNAASEWISLLRERGVLCLPVAPHRIRLVTHADVDDAGIDQAVEAFGEVSKLMASGSRA